MSAHSHSSPSVNGGSRANLFVEVDEQPAPERRRGRGLVVPLEEPARGAARFTRPDRGLRRLVARARRHAALLVVTTTAVGLLLATGWLGLSLRSTADARDQARQQRHATGVALDRSRDRVRGLIGERDRALAAARTAESRRDAARARQELKRERRRPRDRDRRR
jgi:hypothetical protein